MYRTWIIINLCPLHGLDIVRNIFSRTVSTGVIHEGATGVGTVPAGTACSCNKIRQDDTGANPHNDNKIFPLPYTNTVHSTFVCTLRARAVYCMTIYRPRTLLLYVSDYNKLIPTHGWFQNLLEMFFCHSGPIWLESFQKW